MEFFSLSIYLENIKNQKVPSSHEKISKERCLNFDMEQKCYRMVILVLKHKLYGFKCMDETNITQTVQAHSILWFLQKKIFFSVKQLNRQLIAIGQFIISIFAGFLFGFRGVEWMVGNLDFGFRLLLGVMCALVIALAEIYFLAKKLNEEYSMPETVQLGGPTQFADQNKSTTTIKSKTKEHED